MQLTVIPRHEPEVLKFVSENAYRGSAKPVPNTGLRALNYHDIKLISEAQQAAEYEAMIKIVRAMLPEQRDYLLDITAEGDHAYSAHVATNEPSTAAAVANAIAQGCQMHLGGHNAIVVLRSNGMAIRIAAQWGNVHG